MNDKTLTLANPFLPTVTLSTGETVYAGRDRKSDPYRPMRYGNQKQAEARLSAIQPTLEATGKKGAVVKQGDRFLIFVYDAPETIEIDPSESLNVDSLPSWFASEEEREERDRSDTDAVNRLNELDARNHVENPNHDYEGPMGIFEDYEGIDSGQETSSPSLPIQMDNTPNDLSRFKFWDEKPELPPADGPSWPELDMPAEQFRNEFYGIQGVNELSVAGPCLEMAGEISAVERSFFETPTDATPNAIDRLNERTDHLPVWPELTEHESEVAKDLHRRTASKVFNVPESDVTDEQRRAAKTINYGEIYGAPDLIDLKTGRAVDVETGKTYESGFVSRDLDGENYPPRPSESTDIGTAREIAEHILSRPAGNNPNLKYVELISPWKEDAVASQTRRIKLDKPNLRRRVPQGPGKIFATVNGEHINPRNRHNQNDGAKQHVIVSNPPSRLSSLEPSNISSADPLKDETLRRQRLKYKLTGGRFGV